MGGAAMAALLALGWHATGNAAANPFMATGSTTSQPIGHYEFCKVRPAECAIRSVAQRPQRLGTKSWNLIVAVNSAVNRRVKPMNDLELYGKDEVWAYPDKDVGDCEDYVLEKRRLLAAEGVPLSDLLITVVRKPDGEGHAVLTVRTDRGDFILDNLSDEVKLWTNTSYRFLKRQSSENTGRWVSIRDSQDMLVGSVR